MADDDPYFLDFLFNNITDVHFSGAWCAVRVAVGFSVFGQSVSGTGKVSFPDTAGGTPGFTLTTGNNPIAGPSSLVVSSRQLSGKLKADAGHPFTGFSMGYKAPQPGIFGVDGMVFFRCGSKKFQVRFDLQLTGPPANINMGCNVFLWKSAIKKGAKLNLINAPLAPAELPPSDAVNGNTIINAPNSGTFTFTVDPVRLTIA